MRPVMASTLGAVHCLFVYSLGASLLLDLNLCTCTQGTVSQPAIDRNKARDSTLPSHNIPYDNLMIRIEGQAYL